MQVIFGEWVRWTLARRDMDRSTVATALGVSKKSITNLYRRDEPEGLNDVTISKLARLLGMTEPELMAAWKRGLPATTTADKPAKRAGKK